MAGGRQRFVLNSTSVHVVEHGQGHNRVYERLDRVYVSSTLLCGPFKARHLTQIRVSDHKPVFVGLQEPDVHDASR
jgi:endonuclease/exonuclease/phosphatase family metal-dependent hydrolase